MCRSCDKLQIDKIIQADIPKHTDVFMEEGVPVFQTTDEYIAWVGGKFVHAVLDGGDRLFDGAFHMDAAIS